MNQQENRINEAVSVGVDTFVVACPKDMTMYTDAAKTTGHEATMAVVGANMAEAGASA